MISKLKNKRMIIVLITILIPITLGLNFNNLAVANTENTESIQISAVKHHDNEDWLKNSDFNYAGAPWFSIV